MWNIAHNFASTLRQRYTKMRETNTIAAEIVELSEIKSTYNYFLASYEGQVDVENATYIRQNKTIVSENLRKLYVELEEAKLTDSRLQNSDSSIEIAEKNNNKTQITNDKLQPHNPQPDTRHLRMKFEPYHTSEAEQRAILLFNSDRRYSITE